MKSAIRAALIVVTALSLLGCEDNKSEDKKESAEADKAYDDGVAAAKRGDYASALALWSPIAILGSGLLQEALGERYTYGVGVPKDNSEAAKWYRLAAQQGRAGAQDRLCYLYAIGRGVKQDKTEAVKWCRLTAQRGDASAQFMLGVFYDYGEGLPQNYVKAHMWYNISASHTTDEDNKKYSDARDDVAAKMTPAQIADAQSLAARCQASNFKKCD
jgi:TPR repeat protein